MNNPQCIDDAAACRGIEWPIRPASTLPVVECRRETLTRHQPGSSDLSGLHNGRDAVFALIGAFMERSEGIFRLDSLDNLLANSNHVAVTLHFSARTESKSMSMAGIDVLRIENGKIQEVWLFSHDQAREDAFSSAT